MKQKNAVILFGRYPRPGQVKTRLAAAIGHQKATEFYRICLNSIFLEAQKVQESGLADVYFCFSEASDAADVALIIPPNIDCFAQVQADLPLRIKQAFSDVFGRSYERVCIFSTDVPSLSTNTIKQSVHQLYNSDIVIGADGDGGYYVLGMNAYMPKVLEITYPSRIGTYRQTVDGAADMHKKVYCLPTLYDVDTVDDLIYFKTHYPKKWNALYKHIDTR